MVDVVFLVEQFFSYPLNINTFFFFQDLSNMAFIKFMKGAIVGSEQPKYEVISKTDVSFLIVDHFINVKLWDESICTLVIKLELYNINTKYKRKKKQR